MESYINKLMDELFLLVSWTRIVESPSYTLNIICIHDVDEYTSSKLSPSLGIIIFHTEINRNQQQVQATISSGYFTQRLTFNLNIHLVLLISNIQIQVLKQSTMYNKNNNTTNNMSKTLMSTRL
jgi:hypothetical protein